MLNTCSPHQSDRGLLAQEAACRLSKPDDVSGKIGALNTLVRNEDGSMNGYNTDWEAAISSIEDALSKLSLPYPPRHRPGDCLIAYKS
jgi:hypothetical protein